MSKQPYRTKCKFVGCTYMITSPLDGARHYREFPTHRTRPLRRGKRKAKNLASFIKKHKNNDSSKKGHRKFYNYCPNCGEMLNDNC